MDTLKPFELFLAMFICPLMINLSIFMHFCWDILTGITTLEGSFVLSINVLEAQAIFWLQVYLWETLPHVDNDSCITWFFSLSTIDILGQMILYCGGLVHHRMFSSIPLPIRSQWCAQLWQLKLCLDIAKCHLGDKIAPYWKPWMGHFLCNFKWTANILNTHLLKQSHSTEIW